MHKRYRSLKDRSKMGKNTSIKPNTSSYPYKAISSNSTTYQKNIGASLLSWTKRLTNKQLCRSSLLLSGLPWTRRIASSSMHSKTPQRQYCQNSNCIGSIQKKHNYAYCWMKPQRRKHIGKTDQNIRESSSNSYDFKCSMRNNWSKENEFRCRKNLKSCMSNLTGKRHSMKSRFNHGISQNSRSANYNGFTNSLIFRDSRPRWS